MTLTTLNKGIFEPRVAVLHNEWNLEEGRLLFHTSVRSERFVRHGTEPNPVMDLSSHLYHGPYSTVPVYHHEETLVKIDAGYCIYQIFFRQDGSVDSQAFA